ncbi:uncharacterized protein BDR25DRAFT_349469 [Lindgomyces ingoldianus]|uniref:Uncharacterized protein n=1 Tax=Lindgomyces ingoldianus TaxID=673940 RepID=A0ACB6RAM5_9PLEO|nr:uncharacterized protein BDR25DRAFT_349469 [Lindgomyces ingoldianus]KAF2476359.1 hypothetical protein BDR25DRAFT_349469 [Lindgomyces ingoldianus]
MNAATSINGRKTSANATEPVDASNYNLSSTLREVDVEIPLVVMYVPTGTGTPCCAGRSCQKGGIYGLKVGPVHVTFKPTEKTQCAFRMVHEYCPYAVEIRMTMCEMQDVEMICMISRQSLPNIPRGAMGCAGPGSVPHPSHCRSVIDSCHRTITTSTPWGLFLARSAPLHAEPDTKVASRVPHLALSEI